MTGNHKIQADIDWNAIDTVLLDLDGTLLDKYFDDYFWEHYVPQMYAEKHRLTGEAAQKQLLAKYRSREGTLDWTDLDFWSEELGLDIPALKIKVDHLIAIHPYVIDFLIYCRKMGKNIYLVTNAHSKTLQIKMDRTALAGYFDRIVCSEEVGVAKEDRDFWTLLQSIIDFRPQRTILADDTEAVLQAAASRNFAALIYVARPSSQAPIRYSAQFPSIVYFKELMA